MREVAATIIDFYRLAEGLKRELRHSWLSDGRRESVAEHSWSMSLLALLLHRDLERPVQIDRVLKMIIVHDLVEALAGDVPFFETGDRKAAKAAKEREAIEGIRSRLPGSVGQEIFDLFHEFEAKVTTEAKFAAALDNLEVQMQHNLADLGTWEPVEYDLVYTKMDNACAHDALLLELCGAVKRQAEVKMRAGGIDVDAIRLRLRQAAVT
ncbi:haloacid dehalogenase [Bradyrhizobium sp. SSBR45G]|uniref:HD domain-containing protein n=1 Tax=unclassified Bradyrhizobium TaxID=2631580 RepID=UPI0023428D0A|nr:MULTISPECIES: HD domain-containing protein [unclassified Bradyrhizobium]GLH75659.1 haloacid dehalogenase [Bradyrhizobium sp. SSBR45G]GLH82551.1 haloacid dehalogenase [Bradyrhizobium sp. SSBR45R]